MGLNVMYTTIRGSILMMNPLPSMAQAFALLVQDEKQREFKPNNNQMFAESSSLIASSSGSNFQTNYYVPNRTPRGRPFCDFCIRPGHIKEKCYRLHGYPSGGTPPNSFNSQTSNNYGINQHQKAPNRNQYNSRNQAHNTYSNQRHNTKGGAVNSVRISCDEAAGGQKRELDFHSDAQGNANISITKEQYDQVAHLLNQFQDSNSDSVADQNDGTCGAVNFAGPFTEEASGDW